MENTLDYYDIQGNILINYAEFGHIKSRYLFLEVITGDGGREFIREIQKFITTIPNPYKEINLGNATTNIGFTYAGLKMLGLPVLSLHEFPEEFTIGMRGRATILGDDGTSAPEHWDAVYKQTIHIFISIDAKNVVDLDKRYKAIVDSINKFTPGIKLLDNHKNQDGEEVAAYQEAAALNNEKGYPTAKEHFGYTDGISNPFFKGMTEEMGSVLGGGKKSTIKENGYGDPKVESTWEPIATGEFILGYADEAQEYPKAPKPPLLAKNGSFMVFGKFHENVGAFNNYLNEVGALFPGGKEALAAKFVGRWRNGAPLATFPTQEEGDKAAAERERTIFAMATATSPEAYKQARADFNKINKDFIAFDYEKDIAGSRCPIGAHTRRANPRGSLEFGRKGAFNSPSSLDDRRRIIRRGLPYGTSTPESNTREHGTIIMSIVASISRQFEFVFQQWMNYGNDFKLGNDGDPIIGNHPSIGGTEENPIYGGKMIVQGSKKENQDPYFLSKIPRFVETRGGEYFFLPSLTALRMIGEGLVDPT